jgi:hypothetical protein
LKRCWPSCRNQSSKTFIGNVTVSFGGYFVGQAATGGAVSTLSDNTPTGPLRLDPAAPLTKIVTDSSNPTSPILSGTPTFNGPIAVLFSKPVAAVVLDGGFFDAIGGTSIQAFDATGASLGLVTNSQLGIQTYGLAVSNGKNLISGISFYVTGNELGGFGIDNLKFGDATSVTLPATAGTGISIQHHAG